MKHQINLIPNRYKEVKKKSREKRLKFILLFSIFVIFVIAIYVPIVQLDHLKAKNQVVLEELGKIQGDIDFKVEENNLSNDLMQRKEMISTITESSFVSTDFIQNVNKQVPQGLVFTYLRIKEGILEISGEAKNYKAVSQLAVNLENLQEIKEVSPSYLSTNENSNSCVFFLTCTIGEESEDK